MCVLQLAATFLAFAFACALAIQQLNHNGLTQNSASTNEGFTISWPKVCQNFKNFCGLMDTACGTTALAFLTFIASTGVDLYILRLRQGR
jgi:hypothetical protein